MESIGFWIGGLSFNSVCCIYATAPLMEKKDLIKAYEIFLTNKWEYVLCATSFDFPIQRSFMKLEKEGMKMFYPEHFQTRSQDLPEAYHDAGQFCWGKKDAWLQNKMPFSEKSSFLKIPSYRVMDIDTEEDWQRAELLMKLLKTKE
jgi:CMP-N-acetylneuraminic acid synthetase